MNNSTYYTSISSSNKYTAFLKLTVSKFQVLSFHGAQVLLSLNILFRIKKLLPCRHSVMHYFSNEIVEICHLSATWNVPLIIIGGSIKHDNIIGRGLPSAVHRSASQRR